jgi:hypothetical protein
VPRKLRDSGVYPNLAKLQPGDLLLVSPLKPGLNARLIQWAQEQVHRAEDQVWIHAAIYLGDNAIVEIDGSGVRVNLLFKYVATHKMLFRRVQRPQGGDIDQVTGYRIVVAALKEFRQPYAYGDIATTAWDCFVGRMNPAAKQGVRSTGSICSDFFNEAVFVATNQYAAAITRLPVQPADLSASRSMRDLDIGWTRLS